MIAYLRGKVLIKKEDSVIVDNNGLGYKVLVPKYIALKVKESADIELFIHHHVREDDEQLFGFLNNEDLEFFTLLISVSGIGPKTALNIFSSNDVNEIKSAIITEDSEVLKKVSGIGAKTAERIVLELKNKISGDLLSIKSKKELESNADVIDALVSLGFTNYEAREAVKKIDPAIKDVGQIVKESLKILNR